MSPLASLLPASPPEIGRGRSTLLPDLDCASSACVFRFVVRHAHLHVGRSTTGGGPVTGPPSRPPGLAGPSPMSPSEVNHPERGRVTVRTGPTAMFAAAAGGAVSERRPTLCSFGYRIRARR